MKCIHNMILEKVNITQIYKDHFDTLRNDNSKKISFDDYFTFLFLPITISIILTIQNITFSADVTNITITSLAILVGLLINVIVLIFGLIKRNQNDKLKARILTQLVSNISFAILISLQSILLILLTFINNRIIEQVVYWLLYINLSYFFITIFMILKRLHKVFKNEISEVNNSE